MRHIVIGTAGHIDHGKTALVKALTGIDTDRFKEERERGITIDIGFAPLELGPDMTAGFIDVPGHERFVKNMLAGIWGIDMVLLVIAADESIKPQTREHFDICRLLGVRCGLVALTKRDLVDDELAELALIEIREFTRGSFLEAAPIIPVSAKNGAGLQRLKTAIAELAEGINPGRASDLLRLPIDRSFSAKGFGTIVTGTLISGRLVEGDECVVMPSGTPGRVRGLQVHGRGVAEARAGRRTAVNLHGIEAQRIQRGDVLARPGEIRPSRMIDVRLSLLPSAPAPLKDNDRVRFHQGTSELLARVKLLGPRRVEPGDAAFAQVRMERPTCCLPGDRFVLRRYSPMTTIGGGVVLDGHPAKHRAADRESVLRGLERLSRAGPADRLEILLDSEPMGLRLEEAAIRTGLTPAEAGRLVDSSTEGPEERAVLRAGEDRSPLLIARARVSALEAGVLASLDGYHRDNPLRAGMPREELRARTLDGGGPELVRLILAGLEQAGRIVAERDLVRLASHRIRLSSEDEASRRRLDELYRARGLNPPTLEEAAGAERLEVPLAGKLMHLLLSEGRLVKIKDGKVFHAEAIESLKNKLWELYAARRVIDIGSFKELTGTSRKNAIPLLEHLDALHVTRRKGSDREILPPPGG